MTEPSAPIELRPSDFTARTTRHGRARPFTARRAKRHLGRRLAVLAAAIAVPAMAAPAHWTSAAPQAANVRQMPFETAGDSFPGSAFYYLSEQPYLPAAAGSRSAEGAGYALPASIAGRPGTSPMSRSLLAAGSLTEQPYLPATAGSRSAEEAGYALPASIADRPGTSPMSRSLLAAGSLTDHARALRCMTQAIYYEAATEPDAGQRAVAQVILNRVAHPSYPDTVCGVVFQGSERSTGCQFSFTCDGSMARAPSPMWWDRAQKVAEAALSGAVYAPVGFATHYHTLQVHPYWESSLKTVGVIGNHIFFAWRGPAGQASAFADRYLGGEPVAAPHPRVAGAPANPAETDPLALQRAYEAGLHTASVVTAATPTAQHSPAPAYAAEVQARGGDALFQAHVAPTAGQVLEPYARSGQWISQP